MSEEFDIDAGVADIAESMGFESHDDDEEEVEQEEALETEQEEALETEPEEALEPEPEVQAKSPPSSWTKEQHENWGKIPKEAQDYIELREKQMLDGIEQYKEGYRFAHELSSALEPFAADLREIGLPPQQVVYNLMTHHHALTKGSMEDRQQAFLTIGMETGLIPKEGQQLPDVPTRQLQERLDRIEQKEKELQSRYQQDEMAKITAEVETFAADPKNKYFDELGDDIAMLLKAGNDLQTAYDKAVWANPITRAKELERERQELIAKNKKEAESAKKATSVNIKSKTTQRRDTTPTGSWDDTMNEVIRNIRSN